MTFSPFRIPLKVKCVMQTNESMRRSYPNIDFGTIDKVYMVHSVIPNGCYYVLRGEHSGPLLGQPGEVNHMVNMERFVPTEWMTENGIVNE